MNAIKTYLLFCSIIFISCGRDPLRDEYYKKQINGVVIEKYKDEVNHNVPHVIYIEHNKKEDIEVLNWVNNTDFWEYIIVGDSLKKDINSLVLKVKKTNTESKNYNYIK